MNENERLSWKSNANAKLNSWERENILNFNITA